MCFVHVPQKGGADQYHQPLTNRPKPFKNLVKMNNSTVWPCATSSPARSGSWRLCWIPRGAPSENSKAVYFIHQDYFLAFLALIALASSLNLALHSFGVRPLSIFSAIFTHRSSFKSLPNSFSAASSSVVQQVTAHMSLEC